MPVPGLDISISIAAPPTRVMRAFFDADALGAWWNVTRSVTTPRVLGRLGGVFRGTIMQFEAGRGFFVADAFWLPPDGEPIGPMALEVTCKPIDSGTEVRVMQSGFEEGARWRRYYEVVTVGWDHALKSMKMLLEK